MKKKLRNSSFRKAVINGVLIFGGVALLTTGFATWIIGVNQSTANDDVTTVTVDTAEKNNLMLTFSLEGEGTKSAVHIGEAHDPAADGNDFINMPVENKETDFSITPKITLEVGDNVKSKPTEITLAFNYQPGESFSNYVTQDLNEKAGDMITHKNTDTYTLIDVDNDAVKAKLTLPDYSSEEATGGANWEVKKENNVTTLTYKGGKIKVFKWGTFFGNEAPSEFYNGLYDAGTLQNTSEHVNLVANQLGYLDAGFTGKTIVLTATAV